MKQTRIHFLIAALLSAAAVGLPSLRGATITVTELGDGYGVQTNLRTALTQANDGDTIEFDPLLGNRDLPVAPILGELVVDKNVTIRWVPTPGYPPYLGIDGMQANRVFHISPGKTVTISGLTIKNGVAPESFPVGGGIYNDHATLTLHDCTISGNKADGGGNGGVGGGIYNDGSWSGGTATLTIVNSTISGNSAWPGGGIYNDGYAGHAILTITNSTLSGNSDNGHNYGGAIVNIGTTTIDGSTLSGNSAGAGGAIYNWQGSTLTITNSTLSGNFCNAYWGHGGAIYYQGGALTIGNTIFQAGPVGDNIYHSHGPATVTSLGYNLSSDSAGGFLTATGDQINTDPKLGPLQNNGGSTLTHLPAADSPAIDGSNPALSMDQRGPGFGRAVNGRSDIGPVEVQAEPSPTPSPTPTPTPRPTPRRPR